MFPIFLLVIRLFSLGSGICKQGRRSVEEWVKGEEKEGDRACCEPEKEKKERKKLAYNTRLIIPSMCNSLVFGCEVISSFFYLFLKM